MRWVWTLRRCHSSLLLVASLASCFGALRPARIDPARFAARPEWTPSHYALAPGRLAAVDATTEISRDEAIDDVAYLDHVLEAAWPDATDAIGLIDRDDARDAPLTARTRGALCDELARQYHDTSVHFAIGGRPCLARPAMTLSPEPLVKILPGRNYGWRIDRAPAGADTEVAVLAIARFAAPSDPGWAGVGRALHELATRDLVVLDLQAARGDDPRMAFALLAALGREDVANLGWRAPAANDGPYAQVARTNLAAHAPASRPPRSRAVWTAFGPPREPAAIAQTVSPVVRDREHHLAMLSVIVGGGCESACGLVAEVASLASGEPPLPKVDVVGAAAPGVRGDEYGLVRLLRTGIDVTFPTVTYGPTIASESLGSGAAPGFTREILAAMHQIAAERAEERAWSAQPLPPCRTLTPDHAALRHKLGGCPPSGVFDGHAPPASAILLDIALDEVHARTFLGSCPELAVGSMIHDVLHGSTIVTLTTSVATMERLAAAPFVRELEWGCPMNIDHQLSR